MDRDPFEERRREEREPTAKDERKRLRQLWRRMQYDYRSGARTWDWAIPRIEARKRLGLDLI
jgi:hypothetical protein